MSARFNWAVFRPLLIGLALVASLPAAASAQCRLEVVRPPSEVRFDYDPFVPSVAPERIALTLRNPSSEPCEAEIALLDDLGAPFDRIAVARTGLVVEVQAEGTNVVSGPQPGVLRVRAEPNRDTETIFEMQTVGDGVVEAGLYEQRLLLRLRDVPGLPAGQDIPVNLALRSLPRAQLNLAGALGSFGEGLSVNRIDFGDAETGKTERVYVQSRTNAPARLMFSSANKGFLLPVLGDTEQARLSYSVTLAGAPLDLAQTTFVDVDPPRTYQGQSLELILTLGQVAGVRAGVYSDELSIEISTL